MSAFPAAHAALIESFFGATAVPPLGNGPQALLGLAPGERRTDVVVAALQQRLAFIDAHPLGNSPEAGIVRLYVQAAATQLLVPTAQPSAATIAPPAAIAAVPATPPVDDAEVSLLTPPGQPAQPASPASAGISPPVAAAPAAPQRAPARLAPEQAEFAHQKVIPIAAPAAPISLEPIAPAPSPSPAGPRPVAARAHNDPLLAEAARLIATQGGVTPEVVKQVAMLAMARGLPASATEAILSQLANAGGVAPPTPPVRPAAASHQAPRQPVRPSAQPSAPVATGSAAPADRSATVQAGARPDTQGPAAPARGSLFEPDASDVSEEDPGTRLLKTAALVAGGILIASIGLIVGGAILLSNVPPPPPAVTAAPDPAPAPPPKVEEKPQPTDAEFLNIPDAAAVVRLVRATAELARTDRSGAMARLEPAAAAFAAWWPRMDIGQRSAAMNHLVDATLRISSDAALTDRLVATLASSAAPLAASTPLNADQVSPAAWSIGVMARLASEQNLPAVVRLRIQTAASQALTGSRLPSSASFQAGATVALRVMPLRILNGKDVQSASAVAAINQWITVVRQLHGGTQPEQALAELTLVEGLERLLVSAPEPDESRAAYDAITAIAGSMRWRTGDPSRIKLIGWFDDRRVSVADLAAVTSAIISKSGAEGVDSTMALGASATGETRLQLRDAYAAAWNLLSKAASNASESWVKVARDELAHLAAGLPKDDLEVIQTAVLFARINEAAWRRHRGDAQGAADILTHDVSPIRRANVPPPLPTLTIQREGGGPDGTWTVRYLSNDKALPSKIERLRELERTAPFIGPIDADLLAEIALLGGGEIRATALRLLPQFNSSPALVNAISKFLPRAPRSSALARTIVEVTGRPTGAWNGEHWPALARRAVVERLLELLAADQATGGTDHAAALIADAYEGMAAERSEGGVSDDEGGKRATDAAARLYAVLLESAQRTLPHEHGPLTLEEIQQRHEARLAVSRGLVQRFAADQLGCFDLLALLTATERPSRAAEIKELADSALEQHREARDIRQQIAIMESAMCRLWLVRFGEVP